MKRYPALWFCATMSSILLTIPSSFAEETAMPRAIAAESAPLENAMTDFSAFEPEVAAWTPEIKDAQRAAARQLVQDFVAARERGEKTFVITPGHYRFEDGNPGAQNFTIAKTEDMLIEAGGVTFWFDPVPRRDGLFVAGCKNVTIRGLTIDYDPPTYIQGEIVRMMKDGDDKFMDLRLDPGFVKGPRNTKNNKIIPFDRAGRMHEVRIDWTASIEEIPDEPGMLRMRAKGNHIYAYYDNVEVGDRIVLPDRNGRMAVNSSMSEGIAFEDVTIHASPHMAFTEEGGGGGNRYTRCRVVRRPGTGRLLACNADIFHVVSVKNGPTIEECEFSWCGDDIINIQNFYSMVYEQASPTELIVLSQTRRDIYEHSTLDFYDFKTLTPITSAKVVSVEPVTDREVIERAKRMDDDLKQAGVPLRGFLGNLMVFRVSLDKDVNAPKSTIVDSDTCRAHDTVIRNNYFHDGWSRGAILRTDKGLIENNRMNDIGWAGVFIVAERYWLEGPFSQNIVVRNNRIENACQMLIGRLPWTKAPAAIAVSTDTDGKMARTTQNRNIRIEGNEIVTPGACAIFVANTENVEIINNRIVTANAKEPLPGEPAGGTLGVGNTEYAIFLEAARNVTLSGNTVTDPSPHMRGEVHVGAWCENIRQK